LETLVPQPPKEHKEEQQNDRTIVVQVRSNGAAAPSYLINEQAFAKKDLEPKLTEIFSTRQEKVMFVKGDKDLDFRNVAEVIDFGHQAGVDNIGLITPRVEAGQ
jgi:biopolymer transport protein ExbD/biopolymer transport protein TolR